MAGAFDEASRICGVEPAETTVHAPRDARPLAGVLVEVRSICAGNLLRHALAEVRSEVELAYATVVCTQMPVVQPTACPPDGATTGPLNLVQPWECDVMGHMNVQFYASRASEAVAFYAAANNQVVRPSEQRFRFVGELHAGEAVSAWTGATAQSENRLTVRTELDAGGARRAVAESDFDRPGSAELPLIAEAEPVWRGGDWTADASSAKGMTRLGCQEVSTWEVDADGFIVPRFILSRIAPSVPFLLHQMGLTRPYMLQNRLGRAAVGYRLQYFQWPRAGDCIELRSAVALVGRKSWRFRHCLVDISRDRAVCVVEAVIVLLDLTSRRSTELPEAIHQKALRISVA